MYDNISREYMVSLFKRLVAIPSPSGYYDEINPVMEEIARDFGVPYEYDRKHTIYFILDGDDNSKTVLLGAHLDTLGMMVRCINDDGTMQTRYLGGINPHCIDGESVTIHTRAGKKITGIYMCKSHSTHAFDDAKTLQRNEDTMMISLDAPVHTAEDVRKLGIENGDFVSINPHFEYVDGYIKSRFVDDKASVAAVLGALKYMSENNLKPKYRTLLAFPLYEELGHGGAYVPPEVEEYVSVDVAIIGPENTGSERKVSICCKDTFGPYDRALTNRIINNAKSAGCDYAIDVFYRYGSDGDAALRAGNNVYTAAFGMGTFGTHGRERTHVDGIYNTAKLIVQYLLNAD